MEWAVQGAGDATYRPDHRQHRRGDQRRVATLKSGGGTPGKVTVIVDRDLAARF
jgi:hypothetical protein